MQNLATPHGGKCISESYQGSHAKLKWQCKEGHVWEAVLCNIKSGSWCPFCSGRHKTIQDMQKLAADMRGKCLSEKYIRSDMKLEWMCKDGHIFHMCSNAVRQGSWCPKCRHGHQYGYVLEDMQQWAFKKGGKCLASIYSGIHTNVK